MLNTFFSAAVCKILYLLPFHGPNFSFFLSFFPAHGHAHAHTDTHTLISPVSIEQFLLMTICACLENQAQQNYTVTSYTITLISLFRTKKKISLTSTCPWIVMYLWTLYQWSLMKGIHIAESKSIWNVLGLMPKGKCGRMCLQQIAMKKVTPWNHISRSRRDRRIADWGSVLKWHPAQSPYSNSAPW